MSFQHNDTHHNDTKHNDTQHNDTRHNDTQHNDTQHNDTQHNKIKTTTLGINNTNHNATDGYAKCNHVGSLFYGYAECHCGKYLNSECSGDI